MVFNAESTAKVISGRDLEGISDFIPQLKVCPRHQCISTVSVRSDLFQRDPDKVLLTDFFGSVHNVELLHDTIQLHNASVESQPSTCV